MHSPIRVAWFTASAARQLRREVGMFDGVEIGGGLYGRRQGNSLIIEHVGDLGDRVPRSRAATEIDISHCEALARAYDSEWKGFWHVHPEGGGPSPVDLATAGSYINRQTSEWLTVIVLPDEEHDFSGSYTRSPRVSSYVTQRDAGGQIVHRPLSGGVL